LADSTDTLQLDNELEMDEIVNIENVDQIINAVKNFDESGLETARESLGDLEYFKALKWAYSYQVNDIYFMCRSILSPVPITNPPNQLLELVDALWGNKQLNIEQQQLKDAVLPELVTLRTLRKGYLEEASIRRAIKLDKLAVKYLNPNMTYGEIYNIRTMVKAMIASLPDLANIKAQFISDAESILNMHKDTEELDEWYLVRIIDRLYNYQLLIDIIGLAQELTNAKDEDMINLETASELAPEYILDITELQDDKMRVLSRLVTNSEDVTTSQASTPQPPENNDDNSLLTSVPTANYDNDLDII
jgi:hypothetical protein